MTAERGEGRGDARSDLLVLEGEKPLTHMDGHSWSQGLPASVYWREVVSPRREGEGEGIRKGQRVSFLINAAGHSALLCGGRLRRLQGGDSTSCATLKGSCRLLASSLFMLWLLADRALRGQARDGDTRGVALHANSECATRSGLSKGKVSAVATSVARTEMEEKLLRPLPLPLTNQEQERIQERAIAGVRMNGLGPLLAASPAPHVDGLGPPLDIAHFPQNPALWADSAVDGPPPNGVPPPPPGGSLYDPMVRRGRGRGRERGKKREGKPACTTRPRGQQTLTVGGLFERRLFYDSDSCINR